MVVKKIWSKLNKKRWRRRNYTGWFLFGFIPLYIKMSDWY